jgi:hypothetical protein
MNIETAMKFATLIDRVERFRVVGPAAKAGEVMDALHANGFRLLRSGPYTNKQMHPRLDMDRFLYIAEREIGGGK